MNVENNTRLSWLVVRVSAEATFGSLDSFLDLSVGKS